MVTSSPFKILNPNNAHFTGFNYFLIMIYLQTETVNASKGLDVFLLPCD